MSYLRFFCGRVELFLEKGKGMNAILRIIETVGGEYGYHEKTGEVNRFDVSDIPYWKFWQVFAVEVVVFGVCKWGPHKTRFDAKKEHVGQVKIKFTSTEFYDHRNSGEAGNARDTANLRLEEIRQLLQKNGFTVTVDNWGRRYEKPEDEMKNPLTRRRVEIIADPPPARFWKRIEETVFLETIFPDR